MKSNVQNDNLRPGSSSDQVGSGLPNWGKNGSARILEFDDEGGHSGRPSAPRILNDADSSAVDIVQQGEMGTTAKQAIARPTSSFAPTSMLRSGRLLAWVTFLVLLFLYTTAQNGYGMFLFSAALAYAMAGLSSVVVTGWAGQISLAQAALAGVGALAMGDLIGTDATTGVHGLPYLVGLVLTALIVIVLSILVGLPAARVRGVHFALFTLAAAYTASTALFTSTGLTGFAENLVVRRPSIAGLSFAGDKAYAYLGLVIVGASVWMLNNVRRSQLGRSFFAVRDAEVAASVRGINISRVKVMAFAMGGVIAALGGAFYAGIVTNVYSVFRVFDILPALLLLGLVVLSGMGRISGGVLAGFLFIYVPTYLGKIVHPIVVDIIAGVALILIVVLAPDGLVTVPGRLVAKWRRAS